MTSASSQASLLKAIAKATFETLLVQGYVEENEVNIFCRLVKEEWEAARDSVLFQYTAVGMTVPKSVTRVTVDPSVKHIPDNAFRDCTRLVEVQLHEGLRSIGARAFRNCTSLPLIHIPSSVTKIDYDAFDSCTGLVDVELQEGLRMIGMNAFRYCTSLPRIHIPS
jgi:hypothetical protein